VLRRIIKPAAQRLGIKAVNWQILRRSHCTWLVQSGADPKSVQAQMRHSKISTTMYIYAQIVPQQQRIAVGKLTDFVQESVTESVTLLSQKNDQTNAEYRPQTTTIQ
jgi:integrase